MVRQYIGARYVPKIYENSQNPTSMEWENVEYEPFVIVSFQNNSYISRKQVPINVGNPTVAVAYWAQTGFYNGQIAHLQDQIDDLQTLLPDNRNILLISDSYGMRPESQPTWTEILASGLSHCRQKSEGGYGFTQGNFKSLLTAFKNELSESERDEISDIVVGGGWNDARELTRGTQTPSTLQAAIFDFVDYAVTYFKNCRVWLAFMGWQSSDGTQASEVSTSDLLSAQTVYNDSIYDNLHHIIEASYVMKCCKLMDSSYFHPNPTGSQKLAQIVYNNIDGHQDFIYSYAISASDITITSGSATFSSGSVNIINGVAKLFLYFTGVTTDASNLLRFTIGKDVLPSGHLTPRFCHGYDYKSGVPTAMYVNTDRTCTCYYGSAVSNGVLMIDEDIITPYF